MRLSAGTRLPHQRGSLETQSRVRAPGAGEADSHSPSAPAGLVAAPPRPVLRLPPGLRALLPGVGKLRDDVPPAPSTGSQVLPQS